MMIEPALRVEGVRKSYGHVEVLKGIDMQVKPGEVACLVGRLDCDDEGVLVGVDLGQVPLKVQPIRHFVKS